MISTTSPRRCAVLLVFVAVTLPSLPGCSILDFGPYSSFDDWYVGREDRFDAYSVGFESLDGSALGYVVNDMMLRTPTLVVLEGAKIVLMPFALPCFTARHLLGTNEPPPEEESAAVEGEGAERDAGTASAQR
ncbi:MAG: hypothetical protein O7J95_02185 [Planctomycetota bacterium]|nr:hypothetical protein [Planctomycetota bacterium]